MKTFLMKSLKNKFVIISIAFIVWLGFIDDKYNVIRQIKLRKTLIELKKDSRKLSEEIEHNKKIVKDLEHNLDFIEKYGRENYYIKRDGEDLYVFIEED